ncbi:MAG TPA: transcription termination/antitermination NusG family protein, partial [Acidobacteriota bacterium]|nr:transcription termination/antitermination NusG family protein [Acidobacteriota bacterium]
MWTDSVKIQNDVAILARKDWYAVYTIVRHEKTANTMLAEKGIETYLPLREVRSRWKDRIKKIQLPLFPGYLFVCISNLPGERFNILNTQGVVRLLGTGSDPVPVLP